MLVEEFFFPPYNDLEKKPTFTKIVQRLYSYVNWKKSFLSSALYRIKDEWHTTYLIMLCKRWTNMISANFLQNTRL